MGESMIGKIYIQMHSKSMIGQMTTRCNEKWKFKKSFNNDSMIIFYPCSWSKMEDSLRHKLALCFVGESMASEMTTG